MSTNEIFSKDRLCNIIKANLPILRQCVNSNNIYRQRTAILMLMQFIEYVLKYKIQCAGTYQRDGNCFPKKHEIDILYNELTDDDQKDIEKWFSKLMEDRKSKYPDRKSEYSDSFDSIKEFAKRYNTSYQYWRYDMLEPNFNLDENRRGYEKYFYLSDTVTVLRALIKSTDMKIKPSAIPNEDILVEKILKKRV